MTVLDFQFAKSFDSHLLSQKDEAEFFYRIGETLVLYQMAENAVKKVTKDYDPVVFPLVEGALRPNGTLVKRPPKLNQLLEHIRSDLQVSEDIGELFFSFVKARNRLAHDVYEGITAVAQKDRDFEALCFLMEAQAYAKKVSFFMLAVMRLKYPSRLHGYGLSEDFVRSVYAYTDKLPYILGKFHKQD